MKFVETSQFESLLVESTKWIDVRAPIEFMTGAVPAAVNLPLLVNDERHQVGVVYKEQGQEAAIQLGHKLVSGSVRDERLAKWIQEIDKNPGSIIYCYRGGLRSQIVQSWLGEHNIYRPIIRGGYKALRQFLLQVIVERAPSLQFCVVGGPTGSGKTKYLRSSGQVHLDLEALANHRGSAFGAMPTPQPSQADFENALAVQLLQLSQTKNTIFIESESRMVGHRYVPDSIFEKIKSSPRLVLNVSLEERVENIFTDYILNSSLKDSQNIERFNDFRKSIKVITRKLGGLRAQDILNDIDFSQKEFLQGRGLESNRTWIRKLLIWYYDPLYQGSHSVNRD